MTSPLDLLLVRGAPPAKPATDYAEGRTPRRVLVLHVHADEVERPLVAVALEVLDGVPVEVLVGLPEVDDDTRAKVETVLARLLPGVPAAVRDLGVLGRRVAKRCGGAGVALVGADLPWTLGRLADHVTEPRSGGALSMGLVGTGALNEVGRWRDSWWSGFRIVVEPRGGDDLGAFFTWKAPRRPKGGQRRRRWHGGGPVVDLRTLGDTLGADPSTARTLAASYGLTCPDEADPLAQLVAETVVLVDLWRTMTAELAQLAPGLPPQRAFSAGGIVQNTLQRAGMVAPATSTASLSPEAIGRCASAFHGGRVSASLVGVVLPLCLADLAATYPSCFSLADLTSHLRAARFREETMPVEEVEALFTAPDLRDRLDDRATWARLGALFVEAEPHGEALPSARRVGAEARSAVAPLELHGARGWWHAADLISPALAGRLPKITAAFRIVPEDIAPELRPVRLPSGAEVDFAAPGADWGRALIVEREHARQVADPLARERAEVRAKALAVSGAWGVFARVDRRRLREDGEMVLVGPDGVERSQRTRRVDQAGPLTLWHVAAAIPAVCRAILAMAEHDVGAFGGCLAATLTDAIAVPCSEAGGLVPCPGGPYRTSEGDEAVRTLSSAELAAVLQRFDPLLQPWGGRAWKVENGSDDGRTLGLICGLNKVRLARQEGGRLRLIRSSDTSLGRHFLGPVGAEALLDDGRSAWCAELEERLFAHVVATGRYGTPSEQPAWIDQPALRAGRVATMADLEWLRAQLGDETLGPFARYVAADERGPVVLGHDLDATLWRTFPWRKDGVPRRVAVADEGRALTLSAGNGAAVQVRTLRGVLTGQDGNGRAWIHDRDATVLDHRHGLRVLRPVRSAPARMHLVGRGGLLVDQGTEEVPADFGPLVVAAEVVEQARLLGAAEVARRAGIPGPTARAVLDGKRVAGPRTVAAMALALAGGALERTCGYCRASFRPARADARYCRPACRQAAYRQRRAP